MKSAESSAGAIRLALADDRTLFREGVASLVAQTADVELVAKPPPARRPFACANGG